MEAVIVLACGYILVYLVYIARLICGFSKVKLASSATVLPKTGFSVIIPFRDEAANLPALLQSIRNLDYPKNLFEIIFIDDFSRDHSEKLIYKWRMENGAFDITLIESVRVSGSPKKDAIARAVPIVAHDWILTTDADCVLPENWLLQFNDHILKNDVSMIAGPVIYDAANRLSERFQLHDMLSLQGATIGGFGIGKPFMCNGANFGYAKSLFAELGGFIGNDDSASGDDVFLLQKAVAKGKTISYLKSKAAIVLTRPADGWLQLFQQRVRWASKAKAYENDFGEMISWIVFLSNFGFVMLFALACAARFRWDYLAILFAFKLIFDSILIFQANHFLRDRKFIFPLLSGFLYPFFATAVALYAAVGKYRWKGRVF